MDTRPFINIIVPAYNEASRIETSIRALIRHLDESSFPYPYAITVVDNASTDGTSAVAAALRGEFPGIVSIRTLSEKGKGGAVRAGWQERGDIMAFMDADLSADLRFFLPLIEAVATDGYDLAIGNRLGKTSRIYNRRIVRSLASRMYNAAIRFLFGTDIPDHQCGFKAVRKDAFLRLDPLLKDTGWFFDTELLVLAGYIGLSIRSIDIDWRDDRTSKVSLLGTPLAMVKAIYDFQGRLPRLTPVRLPRGGVYVLQASRFLMSGAVAASVNLGLFYLLFSVFGIYYLTAVIFTSIAVFFVSFTLQKFWTFEDKGARTISLQLPLYALSATLTVFANMALIYLLVEGAGLWPVGAQFLSLALIAAANFFVYKFFIFRRRA